MLVLLRYFRIYLDVRSSVGVNFLYSTKTIFLIVSCRAHTSDRANVYDEYDSRPLRLLTRQFIDTARFLPCDDMRCTVFVIVILSVRLSVCPSVRPSVCDTRGLRPHGSTYDHDFFTIW